MNTNQNTVIALGKFDGVHIGHTALLRTAVTMARKAGLRSLAYTFRARGGCLLSDADKADAFAALGVDAVHAEEFTDAFRRMSAEVFVRDVLVTRFRARHVVVGFNYRFGYQRSGDTALLAQLCAPLGVGVTVIDPVLADGEPVSSTRIRALVEQGDLPAAAALLGRRYAVSGTVQPGKRLGRTIGFPTVNLLPAPELMLPCRGVYATLTEVDGTLLPGVTNVGPNPTVETNAPDKVETHLFDFAGELYGRGIRVEFVEKIRDERVFSSVEELRKQIEQDQQKARLIL